jgi:ribosome-binding protein aMBF1 (putative translation factor)
MLRCDMCHKPLAAKRFQIVSGERTLTVGPDCYRKEKKAAADAAQRNRPEYKDFTAWLRSSNASNRACPAGHFPNNFQFWAEGGRW